MTAKEMRAEADRLNSYAADLRLLKEHIVAGDVEKDAAALIRMAQRREMVEAGTGYYHPLTGRFLPTRR